MNRRAILALPLAPLAGCATSRGPVVNYSAKTMRLNGKTYKILTGYAPGGRPGSHKTPLSGNLYVIAKEPRHRFGRVVRLGGVSADGFKQDGRGILLHRTRMSRTRTRGCIGLDRSDMVEVYERIEVGDRVTIQL